MANSSDSAGQEEVHGQHHRNYGDGTAFSVVNMDADGCDSASQGEVQPAADERVVPLWRAKDLMVERLRALQTDFHCGKLVGRKMIRIQMRVGGFGVEQSMLWLRAQPSYPKTYFLNEDSSLLSAGTGSAHTISGRGELKEALVSQDMPCSFRYYGGSRFDAGAEIKKEWAEFGGYYFVLPRVELLCEAGAAETKKGAGQRADRAGASWRCGERDSMQGFTFAVNMRVEAAADWEKELGVAVQAVEHMAVGLSGEKMLPSPTAMWEGTKFEAWKTMIEEALGQMQDGQLRKVVLSRNYFVQFPSEVEPLDLLLKLRTHHGYLFCLQPSRECAAFLGCSPEPLFRISHDVIETMAISGTRPRGESDQRDKALAEELLASEKDMYENGVTTKYIQQLLGEVAQDVETSDVFVMKLRHVQHICRKIRARPSLGGSSSTPQGLLLALNPTPAVCGESRPAATEFIRRSEGFDRGFFGGPVGFLSSTACEFLVAIRSVLCEPRMLHVYAGAGIVPGSDAQSEWDETRLKMQNILLLVNKPAAPLRSLPNINVVPCPNPPARCLAEPAPLPDAASVPGLPRWGALLMSLLLVSLWATAMVEELCRLGVKHFCVCPGSRSTPLVVAVARHAEATAVVMHDERSAGFYCVGFARGKGVAAACIVTSGTAVANLLPAAVEASQQGVPLLLLTADRPYELRDNGSNQTIAQPGLFGGYARWARDVCCPTDQVKLSALLSDVDFAVHAAHTAPRGPVHLNLQFRENLAPDAGPVRDDAARSSAWSPACLEGAALERWMAGADPLAQYAAPWQGAAAAVPGEVARAMEGARRGVVVVGALGEREDAAGVAWLAAELRWPLMADVQSGLRVDRGPYGFANVEAFDQLLLSGLLGQTMRPDVILQFGDHLVSKRLASMIATAVRRDGASHVVVTDTPGRNDPAATATHVVACAPAAFARGAAGVAVRCGASELLPLREVSARVQAALRGSMLRRQQLDEPYVAFRVSGEVLPGAALFLSSSMPVRDADMFFNTAAPNAPGLVASNRGASGIDGVVSSAVGFARGLGRPVTLLIGDVAALHDLTALRAVGECPHPMTVVVVNNAGGGIFSFLPIAAHADVMAPFFTHSHQVDFQAAAAAFGLQFIRASTVAELDGALRDAARGGRHALIEAVAPMPAKNVRAHADVQGVVQRAVRGALEGSVDLHWRWVGDAGKPPVLLLHGFLGSEEDWEEVAAALQGAHSCLVIELPGHGASRRRRPEEGGAAPAPVVLSGEHAEGAVLGVLERLGVQRCAVVGYSMGARVAMRMAKQQPKRFSCVGVLAGHPGLGDPARRRERWAADCQRGEELREIGAMGEEGAGRWEAWLREWYQQEVFGEVSRREGFEAMLARRRRGRAGELAEVVTGHSVGRLEDCWGWVRECGVPALFMAGEQDTKFVKTGEKIKAEGSGKWQVETVPGAAHALLEEAPREVAAGVKGLLQRAEEEARGKGAAPRPMFGTAASEADSIMVASVQVRRFTIPLRGELQLSAGEALTRRTGLVVELFTMGGHVGYGECTPLPGFHPEALAEVEAALEHAANALRGRILPKDIVKLDGGFARWLFGSASEVEQFAQWHFDVPQMGVQLERDKVPKCVRAALEMAVLQAVAQVLGEPIAVMLAKAQGRGLGSHVEINGLVTRAELQAQERWGSAIPEEYAVLKVKVGGEADVAAHGRLVGELAKAVAERGQRLRLDGNQCWTLAEAVEFAAAVGEEGARAIEYIEEPLRDPSELPEFGRRTGMKFALDESVEQGAWEPLLGDPGLRAVVVKPSIVGGLEAALEIQAAAGQGVDLVLSSAFESGIALSHYAIFASVLPQAAGVCHGLGTFSRLEEDMMDPPFAACVRASRIPVLDCQRNLMNLSNTIRHCPHIEQMRQPSSKEPVREMTAEEAEEAEMMKRFGFG